MLIGLIIADWCGTVKTSFTPRHEKDGIFRPPGRVTFPTSKRRETFFDPAAASAAAYPTLEPMLSTSLVKKVSESTGSEASLSGLCVVLQQDRHERQRYEKQTDRLWQTVVSKTEAYRNCTDVRLAGVPDRRGPGRPFSDFSDGAEKSLGPEAETLLFPAVDKEDRSIVQTSLLQNLRNRTLALPWMTKIPGMQCMPGIF